MKSPTQVNRLDAVTPKEPKMLTGSDQNGVQSAASPDTGSTWTIMTAGVRDGGLLIRVTETEQDKPIFSPMGAGAVARLTDEKVGRGSWKKPMPFCNETDRSPGGSVRKQAHFQPVDDGERACRTLIGRNRK